MHPLHQRIQENGSQRHHHHCSVNKVAIEISEKLLQSYIKTHTNLRYRCETKIHFGLLSSNIYSPLNIRIHNSLRFQDLLLLWSRSGISLCHPTHSCQSTNKRKGGTFLLCDSDYNLICSIS